MKNKYLVILLFWVCAYGLFVSCANKENESHLGETPAIESEKEADLLIPLGGYDLPPSEAPEQDYKKLFYSVYRVRESDMISNIADQFGITQDTILSVNNIKNSRLLQIGQYLRIPTIPGILYTVRENGETIDEIAQKYKVSPEKIAYANELSNTDSLDEGISLFIPDAQLSWMERQEINGDLFMKPLHRNYYISSYYGYRINPFTQKRSFHTGIDMVAPYGTPIYAALDGTVIVAGWSNVLGNYVVVRHHSGYTSTYAHMSRITVKRGNFVYTNTKLGEIGNTGMSTGAHLHFAVAKNGRTVNPSGLW